MRRSQTLVRESRHLGGEGDQVLSTVPDLSEGAGIGVGVLKQSHIFTSTSLELLPSLCSKITRARDGPVLYDRAASHCCIYELKSTTIREPERRLTGLVATARSLRGETSLL